MTPSHRMRTDNGYKLPWLSPLHMSGRWQIPEIGPCGVIPDDLIGFNHANTKRPPTTRCGVHFYLDDYQFQRVWNRPERYVARLARFQCALTPDFSLYRDMPEAMKLWNVFRSRLVGAFLQSRGLDIIPTLQWAGEESFEYCFDGLPQESVVSASTVGVLGDREARIAWRHGMREAMRRLEPSCVLLYGEPMPEFDWNGTKVIRYGNHDTERVRRWEAEERARQADRTNAEGKPTSTATNTAPSSRKTTSNSSR